MLGALLASTGGKLLDTQLIFKYINCVGLMKTYKFSMFLTIYQTPGPMQKVSP